MANVWKEQSEAAWINRQPPTKEVREQAAFRAVYCPTCKRLVIGECKHKEGAG